MLIVAEDAQVSPLADIEESVKGTRIEIGPACVIDAFVKIKPSGGMGDFVTGARCYLNSGVVVYTGNGVRMGDDVLIAANCTFAPVNHDFSSRARTMRAHAPSRGGIVIGSDVWIGANSVVLDGAVIGDGVVVGAGSVVTGRLEPYGIYRGSPARLAGHRGP
jgi:acetyltransferase-like isoleucine patch superfamily enzyme